MNMKLFSIRIDTTFNTRTMDDESIIFVAIQVQDTRKS